MHPTTQSRYKHQASALVFVSYSFSILIPQFHLLTKPEHIIITFHIPVPISTSVSQSIVFQLNANEKK